MVLIGADPSQKKQALQEVDVMIRRRAQAGAKIIVVNPDRIELASHQNAMHLQLKAGTDSALLAGLMSAALAEGVASSAKGLDELKKSLITVDAAASESGVSTESISNAGKAFALRSGRCSDRVRCRANGDASQQALNLALLKDAGVLPLMLEANALGVLRMGCMPDQGPGCSESEKSRQKLSGHEIWYESALSCR